jgi:hypothetical protein
MLVSASRRNNLFDECGKLHGFHTSRKVRDRQTRSPARETHALPGKYAQIGRRAWIFCDGCFDIADSQLQEPANLLSG